MDTKDIGALKKSYDKFVNIQNKKIGKEDNDFYAEMAKSIFQATERALDPSINHMHIVPAQTGSGKSTYMQAMVAALCDNGYSSAIVSKTINQAHDSYEIIGKLLDEPTGEEFDQLMIDKLSGQNNSSRKLVIYSSKHRIGSIEFIENQKFTLGKVEGYTRYDKVIAPIVISTHAALLIELETGEDTGVMRQDEKMRDVIFLDESPEFKMAGMIKKGDI